MPNHFLPLTSRRLSSRVRNGLLLFLLGLSLSLQAQKIDSLQKQLTKVLPDSQRVATLYELGFAYWLSGEDSLATHHCTQAVRLAHKRGLFKEEGKARLHLARIEADRMVDFQAGFAQIDTTLRIAAQLKDRHMEGIAYIRKAQLLETNLTRQKEIGPLVEKALAIFVALGDKSWQGTVYNEQAQRFSRSGEYSKAIEFFLKARKLQEEVNDIAALRSTLPNLGVAYEALNLHQEALAVFDAADPIAKKRNDKVLEAFLLNQRAEIFEKQGKYDQALKALEQAVAIHKATGAAYWLPKSYARMARVYIKRKEYANARKFNRLGDKLFQDVVDSEEFLDHIIQVNDAKISLAEKQYKHVIAGATKGLEWAEESDPPLLAEAAEYHYMLAESYEALGATGRALLHYKKYKAASDSLLNRESVQKATASAMKYEFDQQKQQHQLRLQALENQKLTMGRNWLMAVAALALLLAGVILWSNRTLTRKNRELTTKNREIEEALFKGQHIERKRVATELHDNLNTKLAALRWRLEAWDLSTHSEKDQKIHAGSIQMLEDVYADVRQISHNLLPSELQTQGLGAALQKLMTQLNFNPSMEFRLETDGYEKRVDARIEFELYHVTLELVNNILKHSQANRVLLTLTQTPTRVQLVVGDNGVGMQLDVASAGIGLRNIHSRVDSLGGKCRFESAPGLGTTVSIDVPIEAPLSGVA
ncbi:tetratricopeptide repeat protein [Larkinella bovis]|uniref:Oxygen sensor histidine kinase NreB n=1 Tax=Larkinella bovis TaxID=683041 RepID=A0ABW0I507_9BACT